MKASSASTRSPAGCVASAPGTASRTRSIVPHTVEEAYELADAASRDDTEAMVDELGDVLFQVLFLSLLLEERGRRSGGRRGGLRGQADPTAPARLRQARPGERRRGSRPVGGDQARGRGRRGSRAARGPPREPTRAALRAEGAAPTRSRRVLREEKPGGPASDPETREQTERMVGELLLEAVAVSRKLGVDPELALRATARRLAEEEG